jgi:hypothetical protein
VTDVEMTDVACSSQGFKSHKFKNRHHKVVCHDADWIPGVDHNDNDKAKEDDDEGCHHEEAQDDQREEELEEREQIDPSEVNNIVSDARENDNPTVREEQQQPKPQLEQPNAAHDQADASSASDVDEESQAAVESTLKD